MIKKLRSLNEGLPGLILGIIIWCALIEVIGVWFYSDKLRYTTGTLIGLACQIAAAIHLAVMIEKSVACGGEGKAQKLVNFGSGMRFLVLFGIYAAMMYFNLGWWGSACLGLLGLKVSAYAQPWFTAIKEKVDSKKMKKEVKT